MPNWVYNKVELSGEDEEIKNIFKSLKTPETDFDFNKIIPVPKEIAGTSKIYGAGIKPNKELIDKYGYDNGFEWQRANWGTKWNASDPNMINTFELTFNTPWTTPEPVFIVLSKLYPKTLFTVSFADEDVGRNCGILEFQDGQVIQFFDMSIEVIGEEESRKWVNTLLYGEDYEEEEFDE